MSVWRGVVLVPFVALVFVACGGDQAKPTTPEGSSSSSSSSSSSGGSSGGAPKPAPGVGASCKTSADCNAGMKCRFSQGCNNTTGACTPGDPNACLHATPPLEFCGCDTLATNSSFCGCDNKTIEVPSTCPPERSWSKKDKCK